MAEMKPAYLIAGTDQAKIDAARARLRSRAEAEGGAGALEVFDPGEGRGGPDIDALLGALPAMSLTASRRYLLADGVERWNAGQHAQMADALAALPPETTVVLVARDKAPDKLAKAVAACGGEVLSYEAPKQRELPAWLVAQARARGFELDRDAARLIVDRLGTSPRRLSNELDRLALWAGQGGQVGLEDVTVIADTVDTAAWALSDPVVERDPSGALLVSERLLAQGEPLTPLVHGLAKRLRAARQAAIELEAGRTPKQVESGLGMHPYAAKMLVARVREVDSSELGDALGAVADLELWTRGGSDYPDEVALTLVVRRAAGSGR